MKAALADSRALLHNFLMGDKYDDTDMLEMLINEMEIATQRAINALDETLAYVDESNKRIEKIEIQAAMLRKTSK